MNRSLFSSPDQKHHQQTATSLSFAFCTPSLRPFPSRLGRERERERDATSQPKRKRGKEEEGNQHREGHQVRNQEAGKEEADVRPRVVLFWTSSSVLCGRHDTAQDATGRAAQSSGSNEWKRVVFSSRSAQRTRKEQDDDKEREGSDLVVVHQTAP